ncbi:hypothetical protein AMS68_005376 [Peltaster fructicola]|uniref:Uncharacterized protein n=1 Tax=Peltaster fructicola TaxID=286661 RepID=A0A6H0XZ22_9PEZI|nr:hypothetical protein AMS68_005376 [Peltaster fructicola]
MAPSYLEFFFLATAAFATADNVSPVVPNNAQIGLLHFPLAGVLTNTFETIFTATAPVFAGQGQDIYYTDVVGNIIIPQYITSLAPTVGATQAQAKVTANLNLQNAFPPVLTAYQDTIYNISINSNGPANIRIPPGSGTLPDLGPVKMVAANTAHRIFLGNVEVDVTLQDSTGKTVLGPVAVICGQQDINFVIGSVAVNSTQNLPPQAPKNGFVPTFPTTPELYESGAFRFPYQCDFGPLGPQTVDLTIQGTIGTYYRPGAKFSLTSSNSFLRIPQQLVTLAKQAYPTVQTFDTTVSKFEITFDNATPARFNVASTPLNSNIDVTGSDNLVIPIPKNGNLVVGPITAGQNGQVIAVGVGNATATAVLRDASGASLLELPITCNPPSPLELIGVPISNAQLTNKALGVMQQSFPDPS